MRVLTVRETGRLLEYLFQTLQEAPKTRIRRALKLRAVRVNGQVTTRFDHPLVPGDKVGLLSLKESRPAAKPQGDVQVVHEDDAIIVIEKPAGLLTVSTETVSERTAFYLTNRYVNEKNMGRPKRERFCGGRPPRKKTIFVVHRLDREASGLLVFAKDLETKQKLQSGWKHVQKKYYAVVEGIPEEPSGTITSFLRENKRLSVYSASNERDAKLSTTHYRTLRSSPHYALLEIALETGRKHQIRVHLSERGHPIVGDDRYGSGADPAGRLGLHAFRLELRHPVTGEAKVFEIPLPAELDRVLKKDNAGETDPTPSPAGC
ncbi:MAG: RluA family pseudouridine synthase [Candidatus Omnitrophica bacterium]|nr:RluA family pseudouridine synthase [Candidatus Omnitrophota bacterium]